MQQRGRSRKALAMWLQCDNVTAMSQVKKGGGNVVAKW